MGGSDCLSKFAVFKCGYDFIFLVDSIHCVDVLFVLFFYMIEHRTFLMFSCIRMFLRRFFLTSGLEKLDVHNFSKRCSDSDVFIIFNAIA